MESSTRTFHAACHCRSSTFTFTVPTSKLPLSAHFCHCNTCRYTHGTLFIIHSPIPEPSNLDLSTFTSYRTSPKVLRFFCSTCGAHMLDRGDDESQPSGHDWIVATSLVEDAEEADWVFGNHFFVGDTNDGGIAVLLEEIAGSKKKLITGFTGTWTPPSPPSPPGTMSDVAKDEKLQVKCHCGGIDFFISRPSGPDAFTGFEKGLIPKSQDKWFATHDACNSCRLVTSTALISWIFPAISHLTLADGSPYPSDGVFGTAKRYSTSQGVNRTFCGKCGATVTYACDDRPLMIDIAAGLVRAKGVRAEEWVEWRTWKVSYEEDAKWKGFLGAVKEGLKRADGEKGA